MGDNPWGEDENFENYIVQMSQSHPDDPYGRARDKILTLIEDAAIESASIKTLPKAFAILEAWLKEHPRDFAALRMGSRLYRMLYLGKGTKEQLEAMRAEYRKTHAPFSLQELLGEDYVPVREEHRKHGW